MSNIQLVENLYRLRKAHHYTQQEISDLLNISRQAYSNYETSKRTPDLDSLTSDWEAYGASRICWEQTEVRPSYWSTYFS